MTKHSTRKSSCTSAPSLPDKIDFTAREKLLGEASNDVAVTDHDVDAAMLADNVTDPDRRLTSSGYSTREIYRAFLELEKLGLATRNGKRNGRTVWVAREHTPRKI